MKILKNIIHVSSLVAALSMISASYAAAPPIQLGSKVQELIQVVDAKGQSHFKAVDATEIVPGDRILYTTTFKNSGSQASDNIIISNPIPENTRYLGGTAKGENCVITYSVDDGDSWGSAESLKVKLKDGTFRSAEASDYTNIRWEYRQSLKPTEAKAVSFQTQLL